jgi:hypothetical protein
MKLLFGCFAAALLLGCGDNQDPAGAQALWQDIHDQDYRTFAHAPGYEVVRDSNAPHGGRVIIYVNDVVTDALAAGQPIEAWPQGSLIVKDGFDGTDLELVAVMEKRAAGWYWAEYGADGDASYSGSPGVCTSCHSSGDDHVRAFRFPGR